MRGRKREGNCRRERGAQVELKERDLKKVEPRKVEAKLAQKGGRQKRELVKTGLKSKPPKERGALQLWQIQQTLGRGDFIEVTPSLSCKRCTSNYFAFAGSPEGEPFSGLSLFLHPGPCVFGQGHRTSLLEALMLEIIPKKQQFPWKGQFLGDYEESRLSSLLLSEINI